MLRQMREKIHSPGAKKLGGQDFYWSAAKPMVVKLEGSMDAPAQDHCITGTQVIP